MAIDFNKPCPQCGIKNSAEETYKPPGIMLPNTEEDTALYLRCSGCGYTCTAETWNDPRRVKDILWELKTPG